MSNVAIKVEGLGKKYLIKHEEQECYKTFQGALLNGSKKVISSLNPFHKKSYENDKSIEEFWALEDINVEINQGDKVGIIGRNGAEINTLKSFISYY